MLKTKDKKASETEAEVKEVAAGNPVHAMILAESMTPPGVGDLVEGPVIGIGKGEIFIELFPYGTGIIYGREYIAVRDVLRKVNIGDTIAAKIVELANEDGYIELSLKEAKQALVWSEAEKAMKEKKIIEVTVNEANKGGLIINWQGVIGFLPASQLKAEHYPRVMDGDKDRILDELKKLVGGKLRIVFS